MAGPDELEVPPVLIDCDSCTARPLACSECVVSVLLGPPQGRSLDAEEVGAVEVLAASGLVPPLRLQTGPAHRSPRVARVVGLPTVPAPGRQAG